MLYLDNHLFFLQDLFWKIGKEFDANEKLKEQIKLLSEKDLKFLIKEIDDYRFSISRNWFCLIPKKLEEQDTLFLWICYQSLYDNLDEFFFFRKFCKDNWYIDINFDWKDLTPQDIKKYFVEFESYKWNINDISKNISNKVVLMWL